MRLNEFDKVKSFDDLERIQNDDDPDFNIRMPKPLTVDPEVWDQAEGDSCGLYSHDEVREIRNQMRQAQDKAPIQSVNHNEMITSQEYVSGEGVKQYLNSPSGQLPLIYEHNGKKVILDGHHRIVADILQGKTSTKCRVLNVDHWVDEDGCFDC